ncbi:MAG: hypothetical protein R3E47_00015 [Paracoccaceae bacterium]
MTRPHAPRLALSLALLLAACGASPAPQFFGAERHDMIVEGIDFTVFLKDGQAEVIRHGYLSRAERDRVPPLMIRAAEAAAGCAVAGPARGLWASPSLPGDTGEARFKMSC